jgi:hypothetical protein
MIAQDRKVQNGNKNTNNIVKYRAFLIHQKHGDSDEPSRESVVRPPSCLAAGPGDVP